MAEHVKMRQLHVVLSCSMLHLHMSWTAVHYMCDVMLASSMLHIAHVMDRGPSHIMCDVMLTCSMLHFEQGHDDVQLSKYL